LDRGAFAQIKIYRVENMRFGFGKNWLSFLSSLDQNRIKTAEASLKEILKVESLEGKTLLDIGSGSGLTSLAARNLGAAVTSFDYDKYSVEATEKLKNDFYPSDACWTVLQGSVLDDQFMEKLRDFDYVVSWGVLHHTGDMWHALKNVYSIPKEKNGVLYIALYNDQGFISDYWTVVKKLYNSSLIGKLAMTILHYPYLVIAPISLRIISGRGIGVRGMTFWHDLHDWVGGYPFEVASRSSIHDYFDEDFTLINSVDVGNRHGCNEFVFRRKLDS
jgi:2-polyprenyl-6-hydroxyphenyl methylase/3-demethylubiquinone-9 3-methyltransferase